MATITIENRTIGENSPVFIIAEAGINHDGKFEQAIQLIDVAAEAGCDAVKFQLFKAKDMYVQNPGEYKTASGKMESIYKIVKDTEIPKEWIPKLMSYSKSVGLIFMCSPFDESSSDILEECGISSYKLASYTITHLPLIKHIAQKQKPLLFSTAGSNLGEVEEAYTTIQNENNSSIVMMHCVAQYPTPSEENNLNVITTLLHAFPEIVIGFSDHSQDPILAPTMAVALGAKVIEKHFTIDKTLLGADHCFALEPIELKKMVLAIRETEQKLSQGYNIPLNPVICGSSQRVVHGKEKYVRNFAFRTIIATQDIQEGELLNFKNIAVLRPGEIERGLEPKYFSYLLENDICASSFIAKNASVKLKDILSKSNNFISQQDKSKNPVISVIVRTFNSKDCVRNALNSLFSQTISKEKFEIIVVDDFSTDDTVEILKTYSDSILFFKNEQKGAVNALNFGISKSLGDYVIILDADDTFEPKILEEMHNRIVESSPDFIYCDYHEKNLETNESTLISLKDNVFQSIAIGILYKKSVLLSEGGYDSQYIFSEYNLLYAMTDKHRGLYIAQPLFTYNKHSNSMTANPEIVEKGMKQLQEKWGDISKLKNYGAPTSSTNSPRIVFIGCRKMGFESLQYLLGNHLENVVSIYTIDESLERKTANHYSFDSLQEYGVPIHKISNINSPESILSIKKDNPSIIISMGWSQIIGEEVLTIPLKGVVGFHSSLLPQYAGGSPVNWGIINGETEWGISMFYLTPGVDKGDIIAQMPFEITPNDTCKTVYDKAGQGGVTLLQNHIKDLINGTASRVEQDFSKRSYNKRRKPSEGITDWTLSSQRLYNWVRALTQPYPGAFTFYNNKKMFIWSSKQSSVISNKPPGTIIATSTQGILVSTGDGTLILTCIQFEDEEEIQGNQLEIGNVFKLGERFQNNTDLIE
jgi:sialic acid synthase SpsE/methionyl-tRNA formyltransferase